MYQLYLFIAFILLGSCGLLPEKYAPKGVRPQADPFVMTWARNHDPVYNTGNLPIALNSPLMYEGILFAGNSNGVMRAFELSNGRSIWQEQDNGAYHSAPVLFDEHIIYGTIEGRVYARHYLTGKLRFSVDLGASIESAGVIHKGRIFFHTRNHKIFSLDAKTGKILWAYKRSIPYLTTLQRVSRPTILGNRMFVGFADGFVVCFSWEDGVLQWERKIALGTKFVDVDTSPVIFSGKVVMGSISGPLTIINPANGNLERRLDYQISRAPLILEDGKLLVGTADGELVLLDESFKEIIKSKISKGGITSFVPWKRGLAVSSTRGELMLVSREDFGILNRVHLGHSSSAIFGEMIVEEERLALISSRNRLYVYR